MLPLIIFHLTKTSNLRAKHPAGYFVNTPLSHNNSKSSIYPYKLPPNSSSSCFSIKVYQLLLKLTKACFSKGRLCQEEGRMDFQLTGKPGDKEGNSWMLTQLASLRDTMCSSPEGSHEPCIWVPHPSNGFSVIVNLLNLRQYTRVFESGADHFLITPL